MFLVFQVVLDINNKENHLGYYFTLKTIHIKRINTKGNIPI
jgi:hypothetical protein